MHIRSLIIFSFLLFTFFAGAQNTAVLKGHVKNVQFESLQGLSVTLLNSTTGVYSDDYGNFEIIVPADTSIEVVFSLIGFETQKKKIKLKKDQVLKMDLILISKEYGLGTVNIYDEQGRREGITRINPKIISSLPNVSGSFEGILKTLPGVSSNNEMSSQYNVRGGNYDENLVYVNDVEIYRPYLISTGQQEGLSFINPEMVSSVKFSAGGFEAKYGDKLSSVLDVNYKIPKNFVGSVSGGLLGGSINLEGTNKTRRLSYLFGGRQKTNQNILNSLDTRGVYKPVFIDLQTFINYTISDKWEYSFLGNFSSNKYLLIPENRETTFGTFSEVLRLNVEFKGQEIDKYSNSTLANILSFTPNENTKIKFIASTYNSNEQETFDVSARYIFDELESNFGNANFGKVRANRGIGGYQTHARNFLYTQVNAIETKGQIFSKGNLFQWGLRAQQEKIENDLSEWNLVDSAGFTTPNISEEVAIRDVIKGRNSLESYRYSAFVQDGIDFNNKNQTQIIFGLRSTYWSKTKELDISPRASISIKPPTLDNWIFRAATGIYYQPVFYKEYRNINGTLNFNILSQRSTHFVLGADHNFKAFGGKPFKFTSELYYKLLDRIIPYEIDNVRIRYYAKNNAYGYATGMDFKVSGEFVKDLESWFTLSVMSTKEDVKGDFEVMRNSNGDSTGIRIPSYIPRPSDQLVNFSIFFQDKLIKDPSNKVHLNLVFGSGLPVGPPDFNRFKDTLRLPAYRRVDIGFSKEFIGRKGGNLMSKLKYLQSLTFYVEVFNLLKINNTISYLWIRGVNNNNQSRLYREDLYAVPNFLSSRVLSFKVIARF